jgi:hypothetical protein
MERIVTPPAMRTSKPAIDDSSRSRARSANRFIRLALIAAMVAVGLAVLPVAVSWLVVLTPRWLVRPASIAVLWGLLAAFVAMATAVLVVGPWSVLSAVRARRRRDRAATVGALRRVLLASSALASLIAAEWISWVLLQQAYRIPVLPTRFADGGDRQGSANPGSATGAGAPLYLVVVGESSARGEPYHPWLSVGQIVGWQLESVFPGREIQVDIRADGGLCLEQAVLRLKNLEHRPDALIVFVGHNEFQTRYGWSRNVRHYVEDGPRSPLALLELGRSSSSTIKLILATLDRDYGGTPTPRQTTRELIDRPLCEPKEYAFLREDFHRRLDALAAYCGRIGALPILIVPASNDGSFEPSRSVLSGSMPAAARAAFAHEFLAARAIEANDPTAALAAHRRLVEQHPEFAESHYRLARLLVRAGAADEARRHFILARDLDGVPLRCPSDFRDIFRIVAERHDAILIDGPELLARMSPTGIIDDHLFHDAQHMNLAGTVSLAQEILEQLHHRRAFGWPESTPVPRVDLQATARHFGMDAAKWAEVCARSGEFYARTAYVRYDPSERLELNDRYHRAAEDLAAGQRLQRPGLPGLDLPIPTLQPPEAPPVGDTIPSTHVQDRIPPALGAQPEPDALQGPFLTPARPR